MDYEQKCKEYLERAKEQLNGAKVFDYDNEQIAHAIRTTVYSIFPGLKESEDERIRKTLINFFDGWGDKIWDSGIKYSEVLAWLQKQGEQKPAWSEEDKGVLLESISVLQSSSHWVLADKLKSLKDRVGCEVNCTTKKEWSEEDEYNFAFIQEALLGLDGDVSYREKCCKMADWLESLKDRVGNFDDGYKVGFSAAKHNQWKPSDEQIRELDIVATGNGWFSKKILSGLLDQLKKLKG